MLAEFQALCRIYYHYYNNYVRFFQVKELKIHDLSSFYDSDIFLQNNFTYNPRMKVITQVCYENNE